jgi:lactose/L-arabinose transport system ATP-binding protein
MRLEITKLHRELGATMIFVTHDQVEAMTLADKIVVLNRGSIEQVGAPLELYEDPANLFVAGFIGSPKMNFLPATVVPPRDAGTSVEVADLGGAVVSLAGIREPLGPGTKVVLGIRPEGFAIAPDAGAPLDVEAVEHLGSTAFAYARSHAGNLITIQAPEDPGLAADTSLRVTIQRSRALLFDPKNGLRIR